MKRREFLFTAGSSVIAGATQPLAAAPRAPRKDAGAPVEAQGGAEVYTASNRVRSGMALGGIGAGTFELRKNGCFYNWNIYNNFPKESGPVFRLPEGEIEDPKAANLFFIVRYQIEGEEPQIRSLQLPDGLYEAAEMGIAFSFPWIKAADRVEYSARYPFSTLVFSADGMPFNIRMEAWTPFIPHDVKNSSLPLAYFDFTISANGDKPVDVMLIMTALNSVGYDSPERFYTTAIEGGSLGPIISMGAGGMNERASTWGQIALGSHSADSTYYCGWGHRHPYMEYVLRNRVLPNLDDTRGTDGITGTVPDWLPRTTGRNLPDPKTGKLVAHDERVFSSLAKSFRLNSGDVAGHTFSYCWNFPNLYAEQSFPVISNQIEGHYYSNYFQSASDVSRYAMVKREGLYFKSRSFVDHFFASSADLFLLEQVNSQLNTFATNGRLVKSGDFGVLEGLSSTWSWGPIGTMDVMLYGTVPIITLFPELQKSTMRCHRRLQSPEGEIAHGLQKDFRKLEDGTAGVSHRIDLPGQYVMLVMRDFLWTGDMDYLREMYPSIQRALNYIVQRRSFPGTTIPRMKGIECSYDNFPMYGEAAYILSQWLCAVSCAAQAAETLNDAESIVRYRKMFDEARRAMEDHLWNGKYYRLYSGDNSSGKATGREGCLTDQLCGQWFAHQIGLGLLLDKDRTRSALQSILKFSYRPGFGLRNCSWPGSRFFAEIDRDIWVDQGNTCWSGVELAFASFLLYEGFYEEALAVVRTVDTRYRDNGLYFDHQEFGGHYFRPMSAWAILNGLLGLAMNRQALAFDPQPKTASFKLFFATTTGTAHYLCMRGKVTLHCLSGELSFATITITGRFEGTAALSNGTVNFGASESEYLGRPAKLWNFHGGVRLAEGERLMLG